MPIIGIKAIAAVVALATLTGQEINTPLQTQPSSLPASAKPAKISMHTGQARTPKLTQNRSQKPLRAKLSQNR